MSEIPQDMVRVSRGVFLAAGSVWLASTAAGIRLWADDAARPRVRAGLLTDLHHADKPPRGTRHYRDTLPKLREASTAFQAQRPDFVVELGDIIDAAETVETEIGYLQQVNEVFATTAARRHYVLGNHCVDTLTKQEFLSTVGAERSYYSFDAGGVHFVLLDACFREDGRPYERKNFHWTDANLPADELAWLADDLRQHAEQPTIVFAHQRLDDQSNHAVKNAAEVRRALARHGNVRAVFQGHSHKNDLREIDGIAYCTLVAMVEGAGAENSGYSLLDIFDDGAIRLTGFRRQATRRFE